jgi:hypothetical protein
MVMLVFAVHVKRWFSRGCGLWAVAVPLIAANVLVILVEVLFGG